MSKINIPPHLKIAESVTDEEYRSAKLESKIVLLTALTVGIILGFALIFRISIWVGLPAAGGAAILTERIMNSFLKNAHKAKTHRMKHYKELKAFKDRHGLK